MEYLTLRTTDVGKLARIVSKEMREEMKSAILENRTHAYMGFKVGDVRIEVDLEAWENPEEGSVLVIHPNFEHHSPRIEEAIMGKLPSWAEAERDAQESKLRQQSEERDQWLYLYN